MGGYLVYEIMERIFCRSGKVHSAKRDGNPRTFGVRRDEHAESALSNPRGSRFHGSYADKSVTGLTGYKRLGHFQNLRFVAALGWGRTPGTEAVKALTQPIEKGGLFVWDQATMNRIHSKKRRPEVKAVQMDLVSYLIESAYDVALSSGKNVSSNPGWEKFLLEFA